MKDTKSHPWLKIDPRERAWLDGVSFDALAVWFMLELWSADTGGSERIPRTKLAVAVARRVSGRRLDAALAELVEEGQLTDDGDHLTLTVWEQPPVETWQDPVLRFRWQRNQRLKRMTELRDFVHARDRNLCRYCGIRVNWSDGRSKAGGTHDHVDPDGDNVRDNVVVACRGCNGRKRDRTPEQAGMSLLRPGTTAEQLARAGARTHAASAATAPIPEPRSGSPDLDRTQIRPRSGPRPRPRAPARPDRSRSDPGPQHDRPSAGLDAPMRLRQGSPGVVRLEPDDPAYPKEL